MISNYPDLNTTGSTVIARDCSGNWQGTLVTPSRDGWALTRVTVAPAGMPQWVGNVIEFQPHEVVRLEAA